MKIDPRRDKGYPIRYKVVRFSEGQRLAYTFSDQPMTAPRAEPDRTTPERVRDAWVAAVAARDADALRPLLTEDYEVWAHGAWDRTNDSNAR